MSNKDVWQTLSAINVNEHTDKKNNFTYLSWSWAWATLQEYYPESTYKFKDNLWMPNGSCEVWVELTVEGVTREMWLAVTDFKNNPIANPSCGLVANARMRCLVKAIAMFGLGHYIYAGESLPMEAKPLALDTAVVRQFEQCETTDDLQDLWATVEPKKMYEAFKDQAKERLAA